MFDFIDGFKDNILDAFEIVPALAQDAGWLNKAHPLHPVYRRFVVVMMLFGFLPREALVEMRLIEPIVKKPGEIDPVIVQEEMDPETFFTEKYLNNPRTYEFFSNLCKLAGNAEIATKIEEEHDSCITRIRQLDELGRTLERAYLNGFIVPMIEEIDPAIINDDDLVENMQNKAQREGIDLLLECRSAYTQLWAMRNNYNVYVFSTAQGGVQPPVDVIIRKENEPFSNLFMYYPHKFAGRKLATVIMTSPTARNLFLTKSEVHYDKFIAQNDFSAIAKQIRQTNLMAKLVPPALPRHIGGGRQIFNAAAFLANAAAQLAVPAQRQRRGFDAAKFLAQQSSAPDTTS
jgi:hypothetical protein